MNGNNYGICRYKIHIGRITYKMFYVFVWNFDTRSKDKQPPLYIFDSTNQYVWLRYFTLFLLMRKMTHTRPFTEIKLTYIHAYSKHRNKILENSPVLLSRQFQALFHSRFQVLFIFPSRYLFTIGLLLIFTALEGMYLPICAELPINATQRI